MNDTKINEAYEAYEEPKKKVHIKLLIFLALIAALVICWGLKIVTFYYKTHGIGGYYFYKGSDVEVVHQLPEGLTDEDISNAVIKNEYDDGFNHEYADANESDFFVETHYLLGVQNIDNKNCKVYLLSDFGHYNDSVMQSCGCVVKMIDFQKQQGQWVAEHMWAPRNGAMYEGSIRETIPSELADLVFSDEEAEIKKTIIAETEEKVKAYYNTDEVA